MIEIQNKIDNLRFDEADNGVMIWKETYSLLFNKILSIGEKNSIRNRTWRLGQQIMERSKENENFKTIKRIVRHSRVI